jgi:hypothetical protein
MVKQNNLYGIFFMVVNAFALLAERVSANSTKDFKRADIAFIPLLALLSK